eukprot:COSAG01_NODE_32084_length_586_cov_3.431211_1_plen_82_part_00
MGGPLAVGGCTVVVVTVELAGLFVFAFACVRVFGDHILELTRLLMIASPQQFIELDPELLGLWKGLQEVAVLQFAQVLQGV